jgi:hypothetical protein
MIYNPTDKEVQINSVTLEGLASNTFRFNIDGIAGNQKDILLRAKDSLFAFVEATINPGQSNQPFVVEDHLVFSTNGHIQKVKLIAWGRDAYYHRPTRLIQGFPPFSYLSEYGYSSAEVVWTNDKPHVVYGYLMVDSSLTLRMEPGTQVYFHQNAGLWVYRGGALRIEGEQNAKVVLQGDRLEPAFDKISGQWDRVWINEGATSVIKHAIIKNAFIGIHAECWPLGAPYVSDRPLRLQKTEIRNTVGIGLLVRNFKVEAENCLFVNSGNQVVAISGGAQGRFTHCTFANYWSGTRQEPTLFVGNTYQDINGSTVSQPIDIRFENSIIYGNKDNEFELDSTVGTLLQPVFDHCIIKTELSTTNAKRYFECIANPADVKSGNQTVEPVFANPYENQYYLFKESVAVGKGLQKLTDAMYETADFDEKPRTDTPDLGYIEFK